jgi:hypothetical protein
MYVQSSMFWSTSGYSLQEREESWCWESSCVLHCPGLVGVWMALMNSRQNSIFNEPLLVMLAPCGARRNSRAAHPCAGTYSAVRAVNGILWASRPAGADSPRTALSSASNNPDGCSKRAV